MGGGSRLRAVLSNCSTGATRRPPVPVLEGFSRQPGAGGMGPLGSFRYPADGAGKLRMKFFGFPLAAGAPRIPPNRAHTARSRRVRLPSDQGAHSRNLAALPTHSSPSSPTCPGQHPASAPPCSCGESGQERRGTRRSVGGGWWAFKQTRRVPRGNAFAYEEPPARRLGSLAGLVTRHTSSYSSFFRARGCARS